MIEIRTGLIATMLVAAGAASAQSQVLPEALLNCAAESNDSARLRCFDAEVEKILPAPPAEVAEVAVPAEVEDIVKPVPAPQSTAAPEAVAAAAVAVTAVPDAADTAAMADSATAPEDTAKPPQNTTAEAEELDDFGMNAELAQQDPDYEEGVREIKAKAVEVRKRPYGEHVVTLDNGQVWTEKDAEYGFRVKVGDIVTIKKGKLGGFRMVGRGNRASDVKRVK